MAWINWKSIESCVSSGTVQSDIWSIARPKDIHLAWHYPVRLGEGSPGRVGVEAGVVGTPSTTQAPRCHPRLVDRKFCICPSLCSSGETSPWFSLWSYTHSRIQPPTRPDLLESSTKTTAGTDIRVRCLLRSKSFPFRDRVVAFVPKSFIPRAGKPRDQFHDVDCTPSSIRQISRYLHHDLKIFR